MSRLSPLIFVCTAVINGGAAISWAVQRTPNYGSVAFFTVFCIFFLVMARLCLREG